MKKLYQSLSNACYLLFLFVKLVFLRLTGRINIIGISGGPGGGKTIFIDYVTNILTEAGHRVYRVPEAATILINEGEKPGSVAFQIKVFLKILVLEWSIIVQALHDDFKGKIFILCDRTLFDGGGYVDTKDFMHVIKQFGMTIWSMSKRYDLIIYFQSAAKNAPGFFGKETNEARYEDEPGAGETCDHTFVWCSKHPNFKFVYNDGRTFSQKLFKGFQLLCEDRGLPIPLNDTKSMRFYLHDFDKKIFEDVSVHVSEILITQYYLKNENGAQKPPRLRSKRYKGTELFFYTRERKTGKDEYTQVERIITIEEIDDLLAKRDPHTKVIKKYRFSFFMNGNLYEIDLFKNSILHEGITGNAILKITPTKQKADIVMPEFFTPLVAKPLQPRELTDYMIACQ
jgi:predicted ATPase/CYTH domain-containing protein